MFVAALPSGVGFLGAGIIWKGTLPGEDRHRGMSHVCLCRLTIALNT